MPAQELWLSGAGLANTQSGVPFALEAVANNHPAGRHPERASTRIQRTRGRDKCVTCRAVRTAVSVGACAATSLANTLLQQGDVCGHFATPPPRQTLDSLRLGAPPTRDRLQRYSGGRFFPQERTNRGHERRGLSALGRRLETGGTGRKAGGRCRANRPVASWPDCAGRGRRQLR
jgi:hypothetical protein